MEIWLFNLQHTSVLKAQPQQRISNIYIYLHVSDQSVYTGSKTKVCDRAGIEMFVRESLYLFLFQNINLSYLQLQISI